ncbi:hypothetical protein EMPS_11591 [Entomortierella parvispora]|uniref:Uncharacterized protein n=1 Tax=Entomortierella parvispora TaxID=205924 RepID=A0A9P3HMA7_9FUNG|nr:hypothetical protein EMPS_11591 [Entomortierella parvispora]
MSGLHPWSVPVFSMRQWTRFDLPIKVISSNAGMTSFVQDATVPPADRNRIIRAWNWLHVHNPEWLNCPPVPAMPEQIEEALVNIGTGQAEHPGQLNFPGVFCAGMDPGPRAADAQMENLVVGVNVEDDTGVTFKSPTLMLNLFPDLFPYRHGDFKLEHYKTNLRQAPEAVQGEDIPMEPEGEQEVVDAGAEELPEFEPFDFEPLDVDSLGLDPHQGGDVSINSDPDGDDDDDDDPGDDDDEDSDVDIDVEMRTVYPKRQGRATTAGDLRMAWGQRKKDTMAIPQIVRTSPAYKVNLGKRLRALLEKLGEPQIFMTWSVDLNSLACSGLFANPRQATRDVPLFCVAYNREWHRVLSYVLSKWAPKMIGKVI